MGTTSRWWKRDEDGRVACGLCFRGCRITDGAAGACGVRLNHGGTLLSPWLGRFCTRAVDPIEKKPLAHWRPGSLIYSLGSLGCTMDCPFCQNWRIARPAKSVYGAYASVPFLPPEALAREVRDLGLDALALTYNEPTLQAEYLLEVAPLLREAGIATVLVTNGAMSEEAARDLLPWVSAANVDLKAFTPEGYRRLGGDLEAVKRTVALWVQGGVHVELTHLAVPGLNDDMAAFAAMVGWIASLSRDIPLHITRCFPARRHDAAPTSRALLRRMEDAALAELAHVHLGNV